MVFLAPIILTLACLGAGALLLSVPRMLGGRPYLEKITICFATGFAIVGWLFFWLGTAGLYTEAAAWIVSVLCALGLILFRDRRAHDVGTPFSKLEWMLVALIALALAADFIEALAPPVEADTLAYHFQLPKQFIAEGGLVFVPRALDGAVPLLVQMTYVPALLLGGGGSVALTLWTFISGWAVGLLLYVFARRWLSRPWCLALMLLFQTLPAVLYGGGAGQVEPRLALFVLVAVIGFVELHKTRRLGPVLLIGLAAGFYAASKYTGLLFVAAAGITVVLVGGRDWFKNGLLFGLAALVAGTQWYGWNAYHAGDPVFGVLFSVLGSEDGIYWNADYAASMKDYLALREDQISWSQRWLAYPVVATLFPPFAMGAGRVGLGPYFLMIAPFALIGIWRYRDRIKEHSLAASALMIVLFYFLWLGFGGIPKVRHLVPVVPVALVCLALGAEKAVQAWPGLRLPVALAMVLALGVNIGITGFFTRSYVAYPLSGFDKESFLTNNVNGYPAVAWLNRQNDIKKVLLTYRAFRFYVEPPSFFAFPGVQKQIEARVGRVEPEVFWQQMKAHGISHILTDRPTSMSMGPKSVDTAIKDLAQAGCLTRLKALSMPWRMSRTLPSLSSDERTFDVWRLDRGDCPFEISG